MKYLIVNEKTKTGFSSCSPDLGGCVAAVRTRASVERAMRKAIEFHLEGLRAECRRVPAPKDVFGLCGDSGLTVRFGREPCRLRASMPVEIV